MCVCKASLASHEELVYRVALVFMLSNSLTAGITPCGPWADPGPYAWPWVCRAQCLLFLWGHLHYTKTVKTCRKNNVFRQHVLHWNLTSKKLQGILVWRYLPFPHRFWQVFKWGKARGWGHYQKQVFTYLLPHTAASFGNALYLWPYTTHNTLALTSKGKEKEVKLTQGT
jgi:hypothetical protein